MGCGITWWILWAVSCGVLGWIVGWIMGIQRTVAIYRALMREDES